MDERGPSAFQRIQRALHGTQRAEHLLISKLGEPGPQCVHLADNAPDIDARVRAT